MMTRGGQLTRGDQVLWSVLIWKGSGTPFGFSPLIGFRPARAVEVPSLREPTTRQERGSLKNGQKVRWACGALILFFSSRVSCFVFFCNTFFYIFGFCPQSFFWLVATGKRAVMDSHFVSSLSFSAHFLRFLIWGVCFTPGSVASGEGSSWMTATLVRPGCRAADFRMIRTGGGMCDCGDASGLPSSRLSDTIIILFCVENF